MMISAAKTILRTCLTFGRPQIPTAIRHSCKYFAMSGHVRHGNFASMPPPPILYHTAFACIRMRVFPQLHAQASELRRTIAWQSLHADHDAVGGSLGVH